MAAWRRRLVCALAGALLAAPAARAQERLPPGVRGPAVGMATRSVARYLDLERALEQSIGQGDRAGVARVMADDFEVRSSSSPDALPKNDWIARELAARRAPGQVRDLAAREFDDIAVVSFVLVPAAGRRPTPALFVVDVWRQTGDKLLVRYVEKSAAAASRAARPSGRE